MLVKVMVEVWVEAADENDAIRLLNPVVDDLQQDDNPHHFITFAEIYDAEEKK